MGDTRPIRCAIYTRKSSEEGLEQSFNSLDAQREACEAYITSQRHEGWQCLPTFYDDGGFSGGNLERPALKALMDDLKAGKVDLIVVYKIDRLTRSLMDFSSLVAIFDTHKASFVSVTQHFNTTTSMGRLTLNVLLSFAQFEREVTGERIRDKIAASKRKGMWMGGRMPLGYYTRDRLLLVKEDDAQFVRDLFARYLELKSVALLKAELDMAAGKRYSRGALYLLLKNRLYRGDIVHKDLVHTGQHEAIITPELWEAVQRQLDTNRDERKVRASEDEGGLLTGMVFDSQGRRLTPTHAIKNGRRYRYYSRRAKAGEEAATKLSLPAHDLEALSAKVWLALLAEDDLDQALKVSDDTPDAGQWLRQAARKLSGNWVSLSTLEQRTILQAIGVTLVVEPRVMTLRIAQGWFRGYLLNDKFDTAKNDRTTYIERHVSIDLVRSGGEKRLIEPHAHREEGLTAQHEVLLASIARGRRWYDDLTHGRAVNIADIGKREGVTEGVVHHALQCALVPSAQIRRLLEGQAGADFSRAMAMRGFSG